MKIAIVGFFSLFVTAAAFTGTAQADQVVLQDGSVLTGTVKQVFDGKLVIETGFAGELTLDLDQVKGITTQEPVAVQLPSGDQAVGPMEYSSTAGQNVSTSSLGDVQVDLSTAGAIWEANQDSPMVKALKAETEAAQPKWYATIELGLDGQTGNTERLAINGRGEIHRDTQNDRMMIYAQGQSSRENGEDTVKEVLGGISLEIDLNDRWFAFAKSELEYDKTENLDLRASVTGGVGYFVIRKPGHELKLRAGLGFMHESLFDVERTSRNPAPPPATITTLEEDTNDFAIAELGLDYLIEIAPWLLYTHHTTYFPTFDDIGDYRIVMENAAEIPLTEDDDWRLRMGMRNNYDFRHRRRFRAPRHLLFHEHCLGVELIKKMSSKPFTDRLSIRSVTI